MRAKLIDVWSRFDGEREQDELKKILEGKAYFLRLDDQAVS